MDAALTRSTLPNSDSTLSALMNSSERSGARRKKCGNLVELYDDADLPAECEQHVFVCLSFMVLKFFVLVVTVLFLERTTL